jgi:hypothetical protein
MTGFVLLCTAMLMNDAAAGSSAGPSVAASSGTGHAGDTAVRTPDPLPLSAVLTLATDHSSRASDVENMTVCKDKCSGDCKTYYISFNACFSPPMHWPNDPQWGAFDCRDSHNGTHFTRDFYGSQSKTCAGVPTDTFTVDLGECVGPFGKPRPWGTFTIAKPT